MKIFRIDIIMQANSATIMVTSSMETWVNRKEKKSMLKAELLAVL